MAEEARYERLLLGLLFPATFFEGYDEAVLALVLPGIQRSFHATTTALGITQGIVFAGLFAAFVPTRMADRFGRRRLMLVTTAGYTVTTALTAAAPDLAALAALQFTSRVFLGAQYAIAITIVVEDFPPGSRAAALGRLLAANALGILAVALLLAAGLGDTPLGWRLPYLLGVVPLFGVALLRRRLRETSRFQAISPYDRPRLAATLWHPPWRGRLLLVGAVALLRAIPLYGSIAWLSSYLTGQVHLASTTFYLVFAIGFGVGVTGYPVCGKLMDLIGRRPTALLFFGTTGLSVYALFHATHPVLIAALLAVSVFTGLGSEPLLGAMSNELFPTDVRASASAWIRCVFQVSGFVLGPILVGLLGDPRYGPFGSVGAAESALAFLLIPAVALVYFGLPETRNMPLTDQSTFTGRDSLTDRRSDQ